MTNEARPLILAIAPNARGFGFTLLLAPTRLLDWGIKEARRDKNGRCLELAAALMARYRPSILLLEECGHEACRRSARVRELLTHLAEFAISQGITVRSYSREQLKSVFASSGRSKDAIAAAITEILPALRPTLPRRRRIWQSEQHSMAVFEAAALTLTHLAEIEQSSSPNGSLF